MYIRIHIYVLHQPCRSTQYSIRLIAWTLTGKKKKFCIIIISSAEKEREKKKRCFIFSLVKKNRYLVHNAAGLTSGLATTVQQASRYILYTLYSNARVKLSVKRLSKKYDWIIPNKSFLNFPFSRERFVQTYIYIYNSYLCTYV